MFFLTNHLPTKSATLRGASLTKKSPAFQLNVGGENTFWPSSLNQGNQLVEQKVQASPSLPFLLPKQKSLFFVGDAMFLFKCSLQPCKAHAQVHHGSLWRWSSEGLRAKGSKNRVWRKQKMRQNETFLLRRCVRICRMQHGWISTLRGSQVESDSSSASPTPPSSSSSSSS